MSSLPSEMAMKEGGVETSIKTPNKIKKAAVEKLRFFCIFILRKRLNNFNIYEFCLWRLAIS